MENSVYINLWKKLNENFMTAPKDSEGNPQPSFIQFLALVYSTEEAERAVVIRKNASGAVCAR